MYQNPSVLFGVVRIRTSSDKIYLAAILLTHNFTKKTKMKKTKLFLIIVFISAMSGVNTSACPSVDTPSYGDPIILHKDDGEEGAEHLPHRSIAKNANVPEIFFSSETSMITFQSSSSLSYSFTYTLYNQDENVISEATIQFEEGYGIESVIIPDLASGNYRINISTNSQEYYGYFDF